MPGSDIIVPGSEIVVPGSEIVMPASDIIVPGSDIPRPPRAVIEVATSQVAFRAEHFATELCGRRANRQVRVLHTWRG